MPTLAARIYRRLRAGRPIIIVSGLPRSGTSMMMRMLEAGGVPVLTDRIREADESNPHGYFELQEVLSLDKPGEHRWLSAARGKAVKVVSALLPHLPETHRYKVIFMRRSLDQVVRSQQQMLRARGEPAALDDGLELRGFYQAHLASIANLLERRTCFDVLDVQHAHVLGEPEAEARRIAAFLGRPLDTGRMAGAVDAKLHRNR